jgi:hypothetical protein
MGRVALSLASSVFISPPDFPGELRSDLKENGVKSSSKKLARRAKELVDADRVHPAGGGAGP